MELNKPLFAVLFPLIVFIYFLIPKRFRLEWLLVVSYALYFSVSFGYTCMIIISTISTYAAGRFIQSRYDRRESEDSGKAYVWIVLLSTLAVNVGLLIYFKYINFLLSIVNSFYPVAVWDINLPLSIIVPVGISFYTFQVIGYLTDVYKQKVRAERNFVRYALFVSFFPKVTVGPIERSNGFLQQLEVSYDFDYERVRRGLLIMAWGYFCKLVIANRCAVLADTVFKDFNKLTGFQTLLGSFAYTIQIYTDFMGYSLIAVGAAYIFGYNLINNFSRPYFASSIKDFWRRWHISLSSWLRDYIYIPLGGSHCSAIRKYLNVMITFFVSGIWHGANYTFIFWGLMHGLMQILEDIGKTYKNKFALFRSFGEFTAEYKVVPIFCTFFIVNFLWVFFRSPSIQAAFSFCRKAIHFYNGFGRGISKLGLDWFNLFMLGIALVVLLFVSCFNEEHGDIFEWLDMRNRIVRYFIYWGLVLMIVFSLTLNTHEFIYMQF